MMEGLAIRDAVPADAGAIAALFAHYVEKTAITFDCHVRPPEHFAELIADRDPRHPFLIAEKDGLFAGYAYAARFRPQDAYDACVELSIYLDPQLTRGGIGTALYGELERRLRAAGITNLYACIAYPLIADEYLDEGSVAFHERLGFEIIGR
ncbi:MAG: N-acetyltransferase, partial [Atopobiaceae bacterium]|nr:N-acetyltransferase [Atopobiaceae bacterium]